jgi:hypothetical protein
MQSIIQFLLADEAVVVGSFCKVGKLRGEAGRGRG